MQHSGSKMMVLNVWIADLWLVTNSSVYLGHCLAKTEFFRMMYREAEDQLYAFLTSERYESG